MMKKASIIALALGGASLAMADVNQTQASAQNSNDANASLQQQIDALKAQIAQMQKQQDSYGEGATSVAAKTNTNAEAVSGDSSGSSGSFVQSRGSKTDASVHNATLNRGQIQYLASDRSPGVTPIGMISSSLFTQGIMLQRNKFDENTLLLGGYIEADPQAWTGSNFDGLKKSSGVGINLTTATMYMGANLGQWVTAELDFTAANITNQGDSPANNSVSLQNAIVMFGNLDEYPVYGSVGKNRISLGNFGGGGPWTGSLGQYMFRPNQIANISAVYLKDGLNINATALGDDNGGGNFMASAFYVGQLSDAVSLSVNGGYLFNIAGSGNETMYTFSNDPNLNQSKRIGAVNFEGSLAIHEFGLGAGFASTTDKAAFNGVGRDNTYSGAWYVSAGYSPLIGEYNTDFAIAYNQTFNTQAIQMPLTASAVNGVMVPGVHNEVIVSMQRPFFNPHVLIGPEYSYLRTYDGKHSNAFTIDISVYL